MSGRTHVWILRAALYGAAALLLSVVWHWHGSDRRERELRQRIDAFMVPMTGETAATDAAGLMLVEGEVQSVSVALRLRCTPAIAGVWAMYDVAPAGADRAADGVIRIRHRGAPKDLPRGLRGAGDLAIDARYDAHRATGTASARLAVTTASGRTATCRSGAVAFTVGG